MNMEHRTLNLEPGLSWFAIHVRSRHEFKVSDRLTNNGIETFLPVVERMSKWKDRKKLVDFPLFPSYLFVRINKSYEKKLMDETKTSI